MSSFHLVSAATFLSCLAALPALAGSEIEEAPAVERYTYAMDLDIARVTAVDAEVWNCGVIPAWMRYEDSKGREHILEYRMLGYGCSNDGGVP